MAMNSEDKHFELRIEYLYKEYDRLNAVANGYAQSSFDDFKLLGAVGMILAWEPFVFLIKGSDWRNDSSLLLIGFVAILLVTAIVGTRDLLKQSLVIFYRQELAAYEGELRSLLQQENRGTFSGCAKWTNWFGERHKIVAQQFYGLFGATVLLFPTLLLAWKGLAREAAIYLVLTVLVSVFPARAMKVLYGPVSGINGRQLQSSEGV